jgi:4-carboxymuconolactone decarboxylase
MTGTDTRQDTFSSLEQATAELVRVAVAIAADREPSLRAAMARAVRVSLDPSWVEEVILQSYLFAGFPRALNAARAWRKASGRPAPAADPESDARRAPQWELRGELTCSTVYGAMYDRLRVNIRALHPALDAWMIVDGYGKVLSRPALDLKRRELCIVGVCAAVEQDRQLHAHLHGALNAGATRGEVEDVLRLVSPRLDDEANRRYELLFARVQPESLPSAERQAPSADS